MSYYALFKLATKIYQQTENLVWAAGKGINSFPLADGSWQWSFETRWVLSPETEIGGMMFRVCVSVRPDDPEHKLGLRVFVNGKLTAPGGYMLRPSNRFWTESWDCDVANAALINNGHAGPVKSPDRFLAGLEKIQKTNAPVCAMCKAALEEVERVTGKVGKS